MQNKKSQSQIVATVLLILIVIITGIIVVGFVVPFVKEKLADTGCFDVAGGVEIVSGEYTCYDDSDPADIKMNVQVHRKDVEIKGFTLSLRIAGASQNFEIVPGFISDVYPYNGNPTDRVEIPGKNEERTYVISVNEKPDSILVYPISENGKICEQSDILNNVEDCVI